MLGPLIAIVGSDGAGKSTVGEALITWLRQQGPAELCHLGKQSGNLGRLVAELPIIGRKMGKSIETNMKKVESDRGPGFLQSLIIYAFTMRRVHRFKRMLKLRTQGVTILADRFPQMSMPAAIDGPGFGKVRCDRGMAKYLAGVEQRQFAWMTSHKPDLVLRLIVDLETAIARKPDHEPERLAPKIAEIPLLTFNSEHIVDIDARLPVEEVIAQAKAAIAPLLKH